MEEKKIQDEVSQEQSEQLAGLKARIETEQLKALSLGWKRFFDERQRNLIMNCEIYFLNSPAGLPGHNLMLIIAKMSELLDTSWDDDIYSKFK